MWEKISVNRLEFKDEIKKTEFFILCLKRISLFALNLLYSSAKPQESPETPSKSSDKPIQVSCPSGLNLLFPDPLNIHRPQK